MNAIGRRRLRVCMVHYSDFWIDSRIQRQARALAECGHEVHLVCLSPEATVKVGEGTIRIHEVREAKAGGGAASYLGGYGRFFARALLRVTSLHARPGLDLVEAHNMPDFLVFTALLPKLRGTPVILNAHDTFPELFATKFGYPADHWTARLLRIEEAVSARVANALITVTEEAKQLLNARGVGSGRTVVVMNSPDERLFGPRRPPASFPEDGPIRALYHGGLSPRFGAELLIRAVASLEDSVPRLSLRICGTGSEHARLIALAAQIAPDRVDIEPAPVPLESIPAELERAHIGIVPTLRDEFTELLLPVKLLEYVHMGLPAIAPRLPVIQRYFSDGELRFFEPGSKEALALEIRKLCAEGASASARAERAGERLAGISWSHQRQAYLDLVERLASTGRWPRKSGQTHHVRPTDGTSADTRKSLAA